MKVTHRKVFVVSLIATLLFNVFVLSGFNPFFLGSVYSFVYLGLMPGFFIKRALRIPNFSFFESITYNLVLSIAYLLFVGISTNYFFSLIHSRYPLNVQNSLFIFDVYIMVLIIIDQIKKNNDIDHIILHKPNFIQFLFYIVPCFFPVFSILGAQMTNKSGNSTFIMILLFSIALYVFFATIFMKKLAQFCFEVPVYLAAISLLLMFSLRSSYVIGWDIYQEYKVFLLTESHQLWSMENFQDPYNACLSITILPTLFHYFTKVDNPFVFKILYQIIFGFTPVIIYLIAKKFSNCFIAFLSAFFFMSTVDFFLEMPAIVRQEIAFLFFGLLLLTLFNRQIAPLQKKILFIIFSFSIVVSHYSTTYILIALFIFACIVLIIYKKINYKVLRVMPQIFTLEPLPIIVFILFAYIWLVPVTNASSNFVNTMNNIRANITNFDKRTFNTSIVDQIFFPRYVDMEKTYNKAINDILKEHKNNNFTYYPASTYKDYAPGIIFEDNLPLHVSSKISAAIYLVDNYVIKLIKLCVVVGFAGALILWRKKIFPAEYGVLSLGFAIAMIILTSVPAISLFYPIGRLDQQTLFLIGFPTLLSISWLLRFIPYKTRMLLITVLFVTYFLSTTGFISQLVGGQEPQIFLNNSGRYYNEIYLHSSETASIHWLYANNKEQSPVFADIGSSEKIIAYSNQKYLSTYTQVFPSVLDKNGYVYANYANTLYGIGIVNINDTRMEYNFPGKFLSDQKNLIYSNYNTKIYR